MTDSATGSGYCMYIGPNITGLIQAGTVYIGDRAHALSEASLAISKIPAIKQLIVTGDELAEARREVKEHGSRLNQIYRKIQKGGN